MKPHWVVSYYNYGQECFLPCGVPAQSKVARHREKWIKETTFISLKNLCWKAARKQDNKCERIIHEIKNRCAHILTFNAYIIKGSAKLTSLPHEVVRQLHLATGHLYQGMCHFLYGNFECTTIIPMLFPIMPQCSNKSGSLFSFMVIQMGFILQKSFLTVW